MTYAITSADLAALRAATRVVFRHQPAEGSRIEAIRVFRATKARPEQEATHTVTTDAHGIDYGREGSCLGSTMKAAEFRAFEMFHGPEMFSGVAASLKVGDELTLRWGRNAGRSPAVEAGCPGWNVDRLELLVRRGKATLTFLLDTSVCQDNSARMIRAA